MPKMKSHRGAAKRFKVAGSGRIKRARAYKSHLLATKPSKRTRRLRQTTSVSSADKRRFKRLLPGI